MKHKKAYLFIMDGIIAILILFVGFLLVSSTRPSRPDVLVNMQLSELRDFVQRSGWIIYKEYIDQGYTGANTK